MKGITVGFAMCGSFCTLSRAAEQMKALIEMGYEVLPIMSENVSRTDTRFGTAAQWREKIENLTGKKVISSICEAEPIGPKGMTDIMLVAPCTGNTAAKLSRAVTDTAVTMAVKSHLRQSKPVLLAIATNDALGASAQNIGRLLNTRHFYFVPFSQDDPVKKPNSLVCQFELIPSAIEAALSGRQLQPILWKS